MHSIRFSEIVDKRPRHDYIVNTEFIGFDQDYFVVQSLLMDWSPKHVLEIGTCTGNGSRIIRKSLPNARITTIDIVPCGQVCPPDLTKIVCDSTKFDYSALQPVDCWFIDGDHTYDSVLHETGQAVKHGAKWIIFHDADIPDVMRAIVDSLSGMDYDVFQVVDPEYQYSSSGLPVTRVAYAIKK